MKDMHQTGFFGPALLYEGTSQIQSLMAVKDLITYAMKNREAPITNVFSKHPGLAPFQGQKNGIKRPQISALSI